MELDTFTKIENLADHLQLYLTSQCLSSGKVFDHKDNRFLSDQYAEPFLALSLAVQAELGNIQYFDLIKPIIFRIRQEYWNEDRGHFDFINFALCLIKLKFEINNWEKNDVYRNVCYILKNCINSKTKAANWRIKRILVKLHNKKKISALLDILVLLSKFDNSLWIHDFKNKSFPIGYSIYSAALINLGIEYFGLPPSLNSIPAAAYAHVKKIFENTTGFNIHGRSFQQIFGYGPWIYLCMVYEDHAAINNSLDLISRYQSNDGIKIVLSKYGESLGYYDYHHHSVYNAFFLFWLRESQKTFLKGSVYSSGPYSVLRKSGWHIILAKSGKKYSSEMGISPYFVAYKKHLLFSGVSGPDGGPHSTLRGRKENRLVYWGPILPKDLTGKTAFNYKTLITNLKDGLKIEAIGKNNITRTIMVFPRRIRITDKIVCQTKTNMRVLNLPIFENEIQNLKFCSNLSDIYTEKIKGPNGDYINFFYDKIIDRKQSINIEIEIEIK